jgi:hypothetical protein
MVERLRLKDADTLEIQLTVYDDTIWTEPYVSDPIQIFKRNRGEAGQPVEWVCNSAGAMTFDPEKDATVMEDPAAMLEKLKKQDGQ